MKKEVAFNLDQPTRQPPGLFIVGTAGGGLVQDAELARQKEMGLVSVFGPQVIDGKLIRPATSTPLSRPKRP